MKFWEIIDLFMKNNTHYLKAVDLWHLPRLKSQMI